MAGQGEGKGAAKPPRGRCEPHMPSSPVTGNAPESLCCQGVGEGP